MRKLTGYIGALIVVFALMGSILAGYALNVNGESTVINEYEKVTDVSGLYTHSQEPSYIEYNPASNYIGYNVEQSDTFTITNNSPMAGGMTYKLFKGSAPNCSWNNSQFADGAFYVNGAVVPFSTSGGNSNFSNYRIIIGDTIASYVWQPDGTFATAEIQINGGRYWSTNFNITYSNNTITVVLVDNSNLTLSSTCNWVLMPNANGDYVPIVNGNTGYYQYNTMYKTADFPTSNISVVNEWNGQPVYNMYSVYNGGSSYWALVPKTVKYQPTQDIGINYTESNRVNNYPMETDYTAPVTTTRDLNLMAMSASNYMTNTAPIIHKEREFFSNYLYLYADYSLKVPNVKSYKLSDILSTVTFPANVDVVKLEMPTQITQTTYTSSYDYGIEITYDALTNWAVFSTFGNIGANDVLDFSSLANQYALYYVDNGKCEIYNQSGVKTGTYNSAGDIYIIFLGNNDDTVRVEIRYDGSSNISHTDIDQLPARTAPFIKMTYTAGAITNIHYADITKGYAVKNNNVSNVVWNNEYNNGNIQLLFRAEDTNSTYHNDITVGDNNISVDYNDGFTITFNSGDPVAVGKWRNIVLDINLKSGELSAVPVRTFNSYTNVVLDTARMVIGDLVNPTPTNKIEWAPTPNSLMFNVYSTSVFMDTYGVVMVNPTLDITDYFTDLNDFYRLRLYNFSVYGNNITVNGITADVVNNTITIDGQTVQLKEMAITYADGHAYISDSNATIDLGAIVDNDISMSGAWYFETELNRGYTTQKTIYNWNWSDFILDNTQFCIMFMGLAVVALIVARRYCTMAITDYIVLILSFIIALTVQVVA